MPRGMGRGRGAVEKPKDFGGVMKKLVKFCSRYIPVMIFALVLGAAGTVCQIIGPDKLKDMTNEITKGLPAMVHGRPVMNSIDMDAVSRIAWLLVALYVGYALLSYLQSWLMANVTQRTAQQLREAISKKINRLPLKYFDKVSYGDVLSRITNDVDAIGQTLGQSVGSLITSVTLFFGALIMMFYNNVIMTLCAIGASLIGLIFMNPLLGLVVGAGAGAVAGALSDVGINDDFMKQLAEKLTPGTSALFVLVDSDLTDKVLDALRGTGGTVLQSSLSHEDEAKLQAALNSARAAQKDAE